MKEYDVFDVLEGEYVMKAVALKNVSAATGCSPSYLRTYIKNRYKINKRFYVVESGDEIPGHVTEYPVRIKIFDTETNQYMIEDVTVNEGAKKIGVSYNTVNYALTRLNLINNRYRVEEDFITPEQLDEWDLRCKNLRQKFGKSALSKIHLVGVS